MAIPSKSTILALGGSIIAVVLAWLFVSEFFAVDRCLDAGGSFNYANGQCDFTSSHQYASFWSRYWLWVATAFAIAVAALGLLLRQRRMAQNSEPVRPNSAFEGERAKSGARAQIYHRSNICNAS